MAKHALQVTAYLEAYVECLIRENVLQSADKTSYNTLYARDKIEREWLASLPLPPSSGSDPAGSTAGSAAPGYT